MGGGGFDNNVLEYRYLRLGTWPKWYIYLQSYIARIQIKAPCKIFIFLLRCSKNHPWLSSAI